MLNEEVRFLINGEVYIIAPAHKIPVEIRNLKIRNQEFMLDRVLHDDTEMCKIRSTLAKIQDIHNIHRISNIEAIQQLKNILQRSSNNLIFSQRRNLLLPTENSRVVSWLDKARKSGISAYSFLSLARNRDSLDLHDENLVAAERYMEGQDGNYNQTTIATSAILKSIREIEIFQSKPFSEILGRNGAISIEFVTRWGMLGAFDRQNNISLDQRVDRELEN